MAGRVSPSEAIRKWLKDAEATAHGPTHSRDHRLQSPSRDHGDTETIGVAARLDLHSPFQNIEAKGRERGRGEGVGALPKKRRKSSSTSSIPVPPSPIHKFSKTPARKSSKHDRPKPEVDSKRATAPDASSSDSESDRRLSYTDDDSISEIYERRPRRKTRDDKYELKEDGKGRSKPKKESKTTDKKRKRQKRKEKTGAAILQSFNARNVASERLTLKTSKVGLFTKGRASSPQRREGLPDLTFHETKFLNPKRHRDGNGVQTGQSAQTTRPHRKKKVIDQGEEMSRYFADTKLPPDKRDKARRDSHQERSKNKASEKLPKSRPRHDVLDTSSSVPASEIPGRPFLGFGEPGPQHDVASQVDVSMEDPTQPFARRASASIPASRVSWSQSPDSHYQSLQQRRRSANSRNATALTGKVDKSKSICLDVQNDKDQVEGRASVSNQEATEAPKLDHIDNAPGMASPTSPVHGRVDDSFIGLDQVDENAPEPHWYLGEEGANRDDLSCQPIIPNLEDAFTRLDPHDRSRMEAELSSLVNKYQDRQHPISGRQHIGSPLPGGHIQLESHHELGHAGLRTNQFQHSGNDPTQDFAPGFRASRETLSQGQAEGFQPRMEREPSHHYGQPNRRHDVTNDQDISGGLSFGQMSLQSREPSRQRPSQYDLRASIWDSPSGLYEGQLRSEQGTRASTLAPASRSTATPTSISKSSLPSHVYGTALSTPYGSHSGIFNARGAFKQSRAQNDRASRDSAWFEQDSNAGINPASLNLFNPDPAEDIAREYSLDDGFFGCPITQPAAETSNDHHRHSPGPMAAPQRISSAHQPALQDLKGALAVPPQDSEEDENNMANLNDILAGFWKPNKLY